METAIWLIEVAPNAGRAGTSFLEHLANANNDANPGLMRLALKLATGAGKTTVMAMLMAWQTINAVRRPNSKTFTRGFLIVAPGLTIRDRLRVLQPNDPDSYYTSRELIPSDMLGDLERAKIVITNYHAFKLRERLELSRGGRALLQGRGEALHTLETEGQMLQRVMPELMGMKNILVINDEAHHCYREKPGADDDSLELFRNFDEHGNPLGRPRTLLIDSEQLESGDALDSNFRAMAADEIDRFRRDIIDRTGDRQQADNITDQDLLREVRLGL